MKNKFWNIVVDILGIIGFLITLYDIFFPGNIQNFVLILIIIFIIFLIVLRLVQAIIHHYKKRQQQISVKAFSTWDEAEKKYHIEGILDGLELDEDLQIIARTAFRWLCGNETIKRKDEFNRIKIRIHTKIFDVIQDHNKLVSINFILQCPKVNMEWWLDQTEKINMNKEQFNQSVENFYSIKKTLNGDLDRERFRLHITSYPVQNSMTRIISSNGNKRVRLLIVDLGDPTFFQEEDTKVMVKPFVVFESIKANISHYESRFETYIDSSPQCDYCDETCAGKNFWLSDNH